MTRRGPHFGDFLQHAIDGCRIGFLAEHEAVHIFFQRADGGGHRAHLVCGRRSALYVTLGHLAQHAHQLHGGIQREDVQTALHLVQQAADLGQFGAFRGIVEECVQVLLDVLQVALHLGCQRHHHFVLLHLAVQRDQIGELVLVFRHAHHGGLQARTQDARLFLEAAAQMLIVVDTAVEQQHRHRHVHGDAMRGFGIFYLQRGSMDLLAQELQGVAVKLLGQGMQLFHIRGKFLAGTRLFGHAMFPGFLGHVELRAHVVEQGRRFARRDGLLFRQVAVQLIDFLDLVDRVAHRVAARDVIQRFADGRLFVEGVSFRQRFHLDVDAAERFLEVQFRRYAVMDHAVQQTERHPPVRATLVLRHTGDHRAHCRHHLAQRFRFAVLAQPFQQGPLILPASRLDARRCIAFLRRLQQGIGQIHPQRREEQVHVEGHFQAARLQQFLVFVEQAQRGIAGAVRQGIQIVGQAEQGAADRLALQGIG